MHDGTLFSLDSFAQRILLCSSVPQYKVKRPDIEQRKDDERCDYAGCSD
jgi:hypothetical protein